MQITGPGTGTTRVMTIPNANFTAARTDAAQTFSGLQTFANGVLATAGKVSAVYSAGGDFVALFQNTSSATPYGVWIKDAATPTAGYPLLNVSNDAGTLSYLRVDSSNGNTTLTSNLVIATSGKGIDFSATPGTGTSELLADYEEGTWTPVISDGTNNATMGASNSGTYTRVGRMVTVIGYVQMSNKGSISGALRMTGLPFTVGSVYAGASVGFADGLNVTAGVSISMYTAVSTTYAVLQKFSATTGSTNLLATDTTNDGQFIFSLSYFV